MFKKPILAIVVGNLPNSEICKIISRIDAGHCFEEAAIDSKKNLLAWIKMRLMKSKKMALLRANTIMKLKVLTLGKLLKLY